MELIDTQWDVNLVVDVSFSVPALELIDTQWDVNVNDLPDLNDVTLELIDTQWDVNIVVEPMDNSLDGGINRYIVGCK